MALSSRTSDAVTSDGEYRAAHPRGRRIGIALSGGGFRSSAFNLGALQALREKGVLGSADYLAAVSGGNYIASALMISRAYAKADDTGPADPPLWAHASPEERHLRLNTNFLAPGYRGRVWFVLSITYGFILNYLPLLLCMFIAGRLVGWIAYWNNVKLADLHLDWLAIPASKVVVVILAAIALLLFLAVAMVAARRFRDGSAGVGQYGKSLAEKLAGVLVGLALFCASLLVLPTLAGLYGKISETILANVLHADPSDFQTLRVRLIAAGLWLLVAIILAAVALALSRRFRALRTMVMLSAIAGGGLLLVPLLSSLNYSASHGLQSGNDLIGLASAVAVVLLMAVGVHNRRYSMHLFYRERLSSAFALQRFRVDDETVAVRKLDYNQVLNFSEIGEQLAQQPGQRLPKLIVCCAANVTSDDVPVGRYAESFTFEHDMSGGPRFGYHKTRRFELRDGPRGTELTLPSIMAVSGAALAPLMGRYTYSPLRFLMALTDVRLGVWVRNPRHPSWSEPSVRQRGKLRSFGAAVRDGWYEPGALYVLREAVGRLGVDKRFIYLSDGGHWENLGLVELLRRRCTHVLCFDASSGQIGGGQDLGRAIALARSDLGIDIDIDPAPTLASKRGGSSQDCAVQGTIRYPDLTEARIVYAKATLPEGASWDLRAFSDRDSQFPNHSTSKQMYTDEQFEAYRSLGHAAGCRAVEVLNIPPSQLLVPTGQAPRSSDEVNGAIVDDVAPNGPVRMLGSVERPTFSRGIDASDTPQSRSGLASAGVPSQRRQGDDSAG